MTVVISVLLILSNMSFLIIELHGGAEYAAICTDQEGNNLVFEDYAEAEREAADCPDGIIVET